MTVKVRFAPSPTGLLHIGNIRTALQNACFAKQQNGMFILRIDDTDKERSKPEFQKAIEEDLKWLGIEYHSIFKQSDRFHLYDQAADFLKKEGYLYPCYETAEELNKKRQIARLKGRPPIYDRSALSLTNTQKQQYEKENKKPYWRFKLSGRTVSWNDLVRKNQEIDTSSISDPVLIREDGSYLYTLPSVVDDIKLEITHIIRGEDHVTNSAAQIEIFKVLGAPPPVFAHTPLLVGKEGEALSKRLGSLSVNELKEQEIEPLALASLLLKIGTSDAVELEKDFGTLTKQFSFNKIGRAPARLSIDELKRLNSSFIHQAPYEYYQTILQKLNVSRQLWDIVKANMNQLEDIHIWKRVIEGKINPVITTNLAFIRDVNALLPEQEFDHSSWKNWTKAIASKTNRKGKQLYLPIRQALTGLSYGPSMDDLLVLIGYENVKERLNMGYPNAK